MLALGLVVVLGGVGGMHHRTLTAARAGTACGARSDRGDGSIARSLALRAGTDCGGRPDRGDGSIAGSLALRAGIACHSPGRVKVMVVPWLGVLVAEIVPLWASTRLRAMAR